MYMRKGYVVIFIEKNKEGYNLQMINSVGYDFESIAKSVEEHIVALNNELNELNDSGIYMGFGGRFREKDNFGAVAEYWISEMRSQTIYVKFKIFEVEL